ncbi:MAG: AzlC family ABC transporter permease [Lachnospiraceae bacterium]|nr:AzlC family ABC transporter permease [Lachnospiraceae bacterium]
MTKKEWFKRGFHDGIPIGLGYFAVSFTFGMVAVEGGLSLFTAVMISLTNLTSAGQFAGLGIILGGGSYLEMALTQFVINLRYALMSLAMSQKFEKNMPFFHRFIIAYDMTDEIFGICSTHEERISPYYNYGALCVAAPGWVLGTFFGALLGGILPDMLMSALGVAIYGMFLAIIIPPAKANKPVMAVVVASMLLGALFRFAPVLNKIGSGFVIIIIALTVSVIAAIVKPIEENA